ncbi:MAG: LacI family transcriptional regulator [Firmicutes bacterium]|nr:LacI family transcriptional regulator [Bacillota bacterium]
MVTLKDVAKKAGVSIATVSHALNDYDTVAPATKAKVWRVATELGYRPNLIARGLVTQRSHLIGLLTMEAGILTHLFFPDVIGGLVFGLQGSEFGLTLWVNEEDSAHPPSNQLWRQMQLEGIVVLGFEPKTSVLDALQMAKVPVVFVDIEGSGEQTTYVTSDNVGGSHKAVEYLVSLGHRRIGLIGGTDRFFIARQRFEGYRSGLEAAGIAYDPSLREYGDFTKEGGYRAMARLLDADNPPTAVFVVSDLMAFGAMECAQDRGLQIPRDLSIVGFDDIAASEHVRPALTTVRQFGVEMGRQAVNELLALIRNPEEHRPPRVIDVELVLRGSCGPPRAS